nr:unnamed protein product [Callosobruchus chinensis]
MDEYPECKLDKQLDKSMRIIRGCMKSTPTHWLSTLNHTWWSRATCCWSAVDCFLGKQLLMLNKETWTRKIRTQQNRSFSEMIQENACDVISLSYEAHFHLPGPLICKIIPEVCPCIIEALKEHVKISKFVLYCEIFLILKLLFY